MNQMTQKIAIARADGTIAVMDFVTVGRGDVLPFGAQWADRAEGWWMREATPENIEQEIGRSGSYLGQVTGHRKISDADIPADRTFRGAWRDRGGKLEVDMPVAREIHRDHLRVARSVKLMQLDGEWMKATGQKKDGDADAIEAQRKALRDMPSDPRIEAATTPEELKAVWPEELRV
jgi:hypothetical protein